MRIAVALLFAATAACNPFTASDPAQLTFGTGDGLVADDAGADSVSDSTDIHASDSSADADAIALDEDIDASDGVGEEVADSEDADSADVAGEEVSVDGKDTEVLADADADSTDDADVAADGEDTPEVETPDADTDGSVEVDSDDVETDDADSFEDVPDVKDPADIPDTDGSVGDDSVDAPDTDGTDSSDAVPTDVDGVDGTDASDVIVNPPEDVLEDVGTTDSTDLADASDGIDDVGQQDVGTTDGIDGDIVDPPDTTIDNDVPVVDKCLGIICDTSDPCAPEMCDPTTGECIIKSVVLADEVACEDGDFCTVADVCDAGVCQSGAVDAQVCQCTVTSECAHLEDATLCTKPVTCVANVCVLGTLVHCEDGNPCSYDLCVAQSGLCSFPEVPACCRQNEECDDGNACTQNWCELTPGPDQNMCFSKNLDVVCDDGDVCTVGDHCSVTEGICISGDIAECDDGEPCTHSDTCFNGSCVGKALDCSDIDPCTQNEGCTAGECVTPTPTDCSDSDVCTLDSCEPSVGCVHASFPAFIVSESAGKAGDAGNFQPWFTPGSGFHVGPWCAVGSTCNKEIGILLSSDSASITIDLDALGDTSGVPKVLEFALQHHYDIVGDAFPTMEVKKGSAVIDSNVFDGPSEKYSRQQSGGTQPPLAVGTSGTVVINLKRNGAKVSTSPVFQQTFHFVGEITVRDACH